MDRGIRLDPEIFMSPDIDMEIESSPLNHLLRSNAPPTHSEFTLAKDLLDDSEHNLDRLAIALKDMLLKYAQQHRVAQGYKSILCPIRKLPPEILADIFLWLVVEQMPFPCPSVKLAPLLLCHVCSLWREVAIGTSSLWAGIDVHLLNPSAEFPCIWLDRAKITPLSMFLDLERVPCSTFCPLVKYLYRSRHIALRFKSWISPYVLDKFSTPLICLETLTIRLENTRPENVRRISSTIMNSAINLRHFSLRSPAGHLHARDISFPWSRLTSLTIHGIECSSELATILTQCSSLESCELAILPPLDRMDWVGPYVVQNLTKLTLFLGIARIQRFLSFFIFPSLEYLNVDCSLEGFVNLPEFGLHPRFSNNLQHLHLKYVVAFAHDLRIVFCANPNIRSLQLDTCPRTTWPDFFELLTYKETDPVLPNLEVLSVFCDRSEVSPQVVEDLVRSRWWTKPEGGRDRGQLSRLRVLDMQLPKSYLQSTLEKFREEGLSDALDRSADTQWLWRGANSEILA